MNTERFPDPSDAATETEEFERACLIENHRRASKKAQLPFTGRCYNCEEPLKEGRFCDSDCRDDHERIHGRATRTVQRR